jgi:hypothetical protein
MSSLGSAIQAIQGASDQLHGALPGRDGTEPETMDQRAARTGAFVARYSQPQEVGNGAVPLQPIQSRSQPGTPLNPAGMPVDNRELLARLLLRRY